MYFFSAGVINRVLFEFSYRLKSALFVVADAVATAEPGSPPQEESQVISICPHPSRKKYVHPGWFWLPAVILLMVLTQM